MEIGYSPSFRRAYKKQLSAVPDFYSIFADKIQQFTQDPFAPALKTHKLSGSLRGSWAFSVTHRIRVVFEFESASRVILQDIGSHDAVY